MKRPIRAAVFLFLLFAVITSAAGKPDFSGSYTLTGVSGPKYEKGTIQKLRVVQTGSSVEVTQTTSGHPNVNTYPFSDKEGVYVSPGEAKGIAARLRCSCRVRFVEDAWQLTHMRS
jgi:hypothetical protein